MHYMADSGEAMMIDLETKKPRTGSIKLRHLKIRMRPTMGADAVRQKIIRAECLQDANVSR